MKPTSERMLTTAEKRIRTPAIWTILKDYAEEVKELEERNERLKEALLKIAALPIQNDDPEHLLLDAVLYVAEVLGGGTGDAITQKETT